jgi:EAL domain-containing protein (putative c-di-GMP-specific phosphodiesterase class I)
MASIDDSKTGMRKQTSIADLIVKGAIALVTTAFFIGAYLQFQVSFWLSLIAALSVYIALLMVHTLMRRSEVLVSEVSRLEGELKRVHNPEGAAYAPPGGAPQRAPGRSAMPPRSEVKAPPPPPSLKRPAPSLGAAAARSLSTPPPAPAKSPVAPPPVPQAGADAHTEPTLSPWPSAIGSPDSPPDYWSFRPEKAAGPDAASRSQPAAAKAPAEPSKAASAPPQAPAENDLEAVQGMIKRLASEVSLGDVPKERESQPTEAESAMRASLEALHTTADTMRAATSRSPLTGLRRDRDPSAPMPPPIGPGHARLSSIAEAIAAGRVEAKLEPIVGLADHQLHHYQVSADPRDENGLELEVNTQDRQLAKTGLLPMIDSTRLNWAAQISQSLATDQGEHCVFSEVSAESLGADRFLDDLAKAYRKREALAGELVLTFSLNDVCGFGALEWSALTDMRDLGFRFGLDFVTDLDYEFTALKAAGFGFVKLQASDFLQGITAQGGSTIAGADIARQMNGLGFTLIVGGITDEAVRTAVIKCGVPLGQGELFGPPVAVTEETLSGSAAA